MKDYKNIVKDIIEGKSISMQELNIFIVEYIKIFKNLEVTDKQLAGIRQLVLGNHFDIKYAAMQAAAKLNLEVTILQNTLGIIVRADIFEK